MSPEHGVFAQEGEGGCTGAYPHESIYNSSG